MSAPRKKIVFVTGTRAEFGLLTPVLHAARASAAIELVLYATGTHPVAAYGRTLSELEQTGFAPDRVIDILLASDSPAAMGKSIGLGTISLIDALAADQPEAVVVLGDRFEILAVAIAALALGIPLVHLEGGHVTEGAIDDSIRHAVTKIARLHFTSTQTYADRIIQMGEDPGFVHVVGATGLDNIMAAPRLNRAELAQSLGIALDAAPLILATHHPVTAGHKDAALAEIAEVLAALEAYPDATVVFTQANADPGNTAIAQAITAFVARRPERRLLVASLGFRRYLSLVEISDLVLGNSSSGLIEVPSLGVPTVNIGPRQKGRLRAPSVIDVAADAQAIRDGIARALSPQMRAIAAQCENLMGDGTAGRKIIRMLEATDFASFGAKAFYDLPALATGAKNPDSPPQTDTSHR